MEEEMGTTFHIFTTAGGHARYLETVKNLAAARKRLKQLAHNASGDCFLYSTQSGIVELMEHQEIRRRKKEKKR
jgi:hypothetical protein